MDAEADNTADLRRSVRDLIALTALPARWIGQQPAAIIESVADTLLTVLEADAVFVSVRSSAAASPGSHEALRVNSQTISRDAVRQLHDSLTHIEADSDGDILTLALPAAGENLTALTVPLGHRSVSGHIVAASQRAGFPDSMARSLCQVAANQAAIALQEADILARLYETIGVLQTITDNSDTCYFLLDNEGHCKFLNPAAERLFGYSLREIRGKSMHEVYHYKHEDGCPFPESECILAGALATHRHAWDPDHVMIRKDGTFVPVQCILNPVALEGKRFATVVEVRDVTETKRRDRELVARMEREGLLNKISLAIRSTLDRREIERIASQLIGRALGADRALFIHLDVDANRLSVSTDWCVPDLNSIVGEYHPPSKEDVAALFPEHDTLVVRDIDDKDLPAAVVGGMRATDIQALIDVPLYAGSSLIAVLCVASTAPRAWTDDEIALVEGVAAQTSTAIEAADTVQREHRIAATLQAALMPSLPSRMPGLEIAGHYQVALRESNIGGDFSAIYSIDMDRYAIVVGDVSGKGLLAASQVAAIQNMLRYAVCAASTLAAACSQMNEIVITQNLLVGFATLFVGIYEASSRTLTYVSCGHEPALVRRTSGAIDQLPSCGPPLGVAEKFTYSDSQARFDSGDALLLYTDGLSEAGPSHRDLLGVDRLADLLASCPANDPATIVRNIVEGAQAHAQGGFRDDVCIVGLVMRKDE